MHIKNQSGEDVKAEIIGFFYENGERVNIAESYDKETTVYLRASDSLENAAIPEHEPRAEAQEDLGTVAVESAVKPIEQAAEAYREPTVAELDVKKPIYVTRSKSDKVSVAYYETNPQSLINDYPIAHIVEGGQVIGGKPVNERVLSPVIQEELKTRYDAQFSIPEQAVTTNNEEVPLESAPEMLVESDDEKELNRLEAVRKDYFDSLPKQDQVAVHQFATALYDNERTSAEKKLSYSAQRSRAHYGYADMLKQIRDQQVKMGMFKK